MTGERANTGILRCAQNDNFIVVWALVMAAVAALEEGFSAEDEGTGTDDGYSRDMARRTRATAASGVGATAERCPILRPGRGRSFS